MRAEGVALAVLLAGCGRAPDWEGEPAVVVLVMDGVRPEESLGDDGATSTATGDHPSVLMPDTWDTLIPQGARAVTGLNLGITITAPAHCELLTGRRLPLANYPVIGGAGLYRPELPALTDSFRAQHGLPGEQVVVTGNTGFVASFNKSLWPGLSDDDAPVFQLTGKSRSPGVPVDEDKPVFSALESMLRDQQPRLVVANLHGSDRAAHHGEEGDYIDAVDDLDRELARFWETFRDLPGYKDAGYLVLVADHGRHWFSDDAPVWRNHGDDCLGCRRIPVMILGPDVKAGAVISEPVTLSDVTATVAALLDVEMPGATGLPLHGLFEGGLDAVTPTGTLEVATAGGSLAETRLLGDPWQRSAVYVDGEAVSSPDALAAEAPVMAATRTTQWICFRELTLDLAGTHAPWLPRCLEREGDGPWTELPPLDALVSGLWRPAMHATTDGQLAVTWVDNPHGHGNLKDTTGDVALKRSVLRDGAWSEQVLIDAVTFPDHPAAIAGAPAVVAAASNTSDKRHRRRLFDSDGLARSVEADLGEGDWRLERPDLARDADGAAWLAFLAHHSDGTRVVTAPAEGRWQPAAVDTDAAPLPSVSPRWASAPDGSTAVLFGALDGTQLQLCAAARGAAARCQDLDGDLLNEIAVDGAAAWITVRSRDGAWAAQAIDWTDLL